MRLPMLMVAPLGTILSIKKIITKKHLQKYSI